MRRRKIPPRRDEMRMADTAALPRLYAHGISAVAAQVVEAKRALTAT
jgi:hypothetical protein